jgi:hypothetical protein
MRYNFVSIGAQGPGGFRPKPYGVPLGGPPPHFLQRSRKAIIRFFARIERVFAEWPCEQLPDAGELMLAGLGSPVFSLSRYTADPARVDAKCGSQGDSEVGSRASRPQ